MDVRSVIVNPNFFCPRLFRRRFCVKEYDVCLYALSIKDTCGKPKNCVQIGGFQQTFSDRFTRAALKQDIVRHDDCGLSGCFENGFDVLDEI
jgi:hypothetical protein